MRELNFYEKTVGDKINSGFAGALGNFKRRREEMAVCCCIFGVSPERFQPMTSAFA
ncbi:MAG: hypothetical protein QW674_04035 [Candidatus Bathyarchaeia archaeon]